jgi:hypothetical protein
MLSRSNVKPTLKTEVYSIGSREHAHHLLSRRVATRAEILTLVTDHR